jgi:alkanesulfonate monooxygenase SsuD/methylene tetrahydromethanopterin reductase-like flavin-dependent oxidoreductase (luciferase family)
MKFGITLSNRGILLGLTTVPKLLALSDVAEACPLMDSIWVGDALFVNQRLDALTPLAAIAAVADAKRYLDLYYGASYTPERPHAWGPIGTPAQCATWIRRFEGAGRQGFSFRLATMGDAMTQYRRLTEEVLPLI